MENTCDTKKIECLADLFKLKGKLIVPSYQRAYAWEVEQLNQFVSDMLEMKNRGKYYYGHFILEEANDGYEIIDGQQRITTFILFLMVCGLFKSNDFEMYIQKFETVDYDREVFTCIKRNLKLCEKEWELVDLGFNEEVTLSAKRILFALNHFRKFFIENKSELKLYTEQIDSYIETLTQAHVSAHIAVGKAISVQIFELQNTRGIKLNLIEKVKAKLMKVAYLNADIGAREDVISLLQEHFAEIYRLEESVISNSFRGDLMLEDILLHHLRIVDDGIKLITNNKDDFNSPIKFGEKEKLILEYLDNRISDNSGMISIEYIKNLTAKFRKTVELVSVILPKIDIENHLVGDVLILDRTLSLEFFILLYHKGNSNFIQESDFMRLWEKLLFTRDFHDRYYTMKKRDDFEELFLQIAKGANFREVLHLYVNQGFRPHIMDENNLPLTVLNFIKLNENGFLKNAFQWWNGKIVYALYKYEREKGTDMNQLREIMKNGRSVEHILPQEWRWEWINENDKTNISEEGKKFGEAIQNIINGVGNLILISPSENSSLSNNHPQDKFYNSCTGGSYTEHNTSRKNWSDHKNWLSIINERGNNIFTFIKGFI